MSNRQQIQTGTYLTLSQAADYLAAKGLPVNRKKLSHAAEPDHEGRRKLPFFKCPITGRLIIDRGVLDALYQTGHSQALKSWKK